MVMGAGKTVCVEPTKFICVFNFVPVMSIYIRIFEKEKSIIVVPILTQI